MRVNSRLPEGEHVLDTLCKVTLAAADSARNLVDLRYGVLNRTWGQSCGERFDAAPCRNRCCAPRKCQ